MATMNLSIRIINICSTILLSSALLTGCGGGGSSSAPDTSEEQADSRGGLVNQNEENTVEQSKTGNFIDSPVSGIRYKTLTFTGVTDTSGTFQYSTNEIIEFSIGSLTLGAAIADSTVTPLELGTLSGSLQDGELDYQNNHQDRATNTLRLLQTLDSDSYPDNGISISENTRFSINSLVNNTINFNLAGDAFETQQALLDLLSLATNTGELVSAKQAIEHFKTTLESLRSR
ncbi:hypothetical protein A9Q81_04580 [Gammaproteobacteria bacterium 42_54_T18]|nr:hypothetical protein A9Q81_04580 [Gammaproteobacteria bacterium 42_54_T18]